jgi:type I restriction enzyme S subunit
MTMREEAWLEVRIGDLGEVFTGRTPSTDHPSYFGDDYPFITPGDMRQGKYARATERSVSLEGAELLKRIKIPANSVCVSCIGWQMGEVVMTAQPSFTNQQINTIVPNSNVESSFLYYSLRPRKQELLSLGAATGVRTPILNKSVFCNLKLKIPPFPVQRRIASILSAYDDLIENNGRRIKILEEMAQLIYREWFVNFRFPGHEKVKIVGSVKGGIPEGWKACSATEALYVNPSINVPREGMKPFVSMRALSEHSMLIADAEKRDGNNGSKFQNGDTLFARITPCLENGKTGFVQFLPGSESVAFGSTEFIVLRSRTLCPEFVYLMARSNEFREIAIKSMSGATGRQRVQERCFEKFTIANPPSEIALQFQNIVQPMFRLIQILYLQSVYLRKTCDLLLSKLMSGEINVEKFEPEAVRQT